MDSPYGVWLARLMTRKKAGMAFGGVPDYGDNQGYQTQNVDYTMPLYFGGSSGQITLRVQQQNTLFGQHGLAPYRKGAEDFAPQYGASAQDGGGRNVIESLDPNSPNTNAYLDKSPKGEYVITHHYLASPRFDPTRLGFAPINGGDNSTSAGKVYMNENGESMIILHSGEVVHTKPIRRQDQQRYSPVPQRNYNPMGRR